MRTSAASEHRLDRLVGRQLRQQFKRGGADDILRTYLRLHERTGKIVGEHWLWCALERMANGEPELEVMADYMYIYIGPQKKGRAALMREAGFTRRITSLPVMNDAAQR